MSHDFIDPDQDDLKSKSSILSIKRDIAEGVHFEKTESDLEDLEIDFKHARQQLKRLTNKAKDAVEDALRAAQANNDPKQWVAVANVLRVAADVNMAFIDIHDKRQKTRKNIVTGTDSHDPENTKQGITNNIQNNFISFRELIGTTKELIEQAKLLENTVTYENEEIVVSDNQALEIKNENK